MKILVIFKLLSQPLLEVKDTCPAMRDVRFQDQLVRRVTFQIKHSSNEKLMKVRSEFAK